MDTKENFKNAETKPDGYMLLGIVRVYKTLCLPLKLCSFFKHGIPYTYLIRSKDDKGEFHYHIGWYFNNEGCEKGKVGYFDKKKELKHYNYSNQKFVGYKLSLKLSYRQMFRWWFRSKYYA